MTTVIFDKVIRQDDCSLLEETVRSAISGSRKELKSQKCKISDPVANVQARYLQDLSLGISVLTVFP
jgi:hypothetical protein